MKVNSSVILLAALLYAVVARHADAVTISNPFEGKSGANLPTVLVLGGGVGGLAAAQELSERGFQVKVIEALGQLGGKARSFGATGTGTQGRADLPAEHGFRIFAGEYGSTHDIMKRIPFTKYGRKSVDDNFIEGTEALFASDKGGPTFVIPSSFPKNKEQWKNFLQYFRSISGYLSKAEAMEFVTRMIIIQTSCVDRRYAEFEKVSWWDYMHTNDFSTNYADIVKLISGNILAADPKTDNAHVVGALADDLVLRTLIPGQQGILVMLDGPTQDMWIDPWVHHLKSLGVEFVMNTTLKSFNLASGTKHVEYVTLQDQDGNESQQSADIYIASIPAEKMVEVQLNSPKFAAATPSMKNVNKLETAWMVGVQYYLSEDIPVINGNIGFLRSPWSLAAVSQDQFRPYLNVSDMGDGTVRGVLSVTVSNWTTPGLFACKKPALECSREEVLEEVWQQLSHWLPTYLGSKASLLRTEFIDPGLQFRPDGNGEPTSNWSPLLINTVGSWDNRPEAVTEVDNVFLAADYVKAPQNVACMETAVQAARKAVSAIFEQYSLPFKTLDLFDWETSHKNEGPLRLLFGPLRDLDKKRFKEGKPHIFCKSPACMGNQEFGSDVHKFVQSVIDAVTKEWQTASAGF